MARLDKVCVKCHGGFRVNAACSTIERTVCVICEKASKPKRSPRQPKQARSYTCIDCGVQRHGGRGWRVRCPECKVQASRERHRLRKAKKRRPPRTIKCEGCGGVEVVLNKKSSLPFCGVCRAFNEIWYKTRNSGRRPQFILDFDRAIKNAAPKYPRAEHCYDAHIRLYNRSLKIQEKPWRAFGLSEADKYRIRYAHDTEFALAQRTKSRLRRKGLGFTAGYRLRRALSGKGDERSETRFEATLGYTSADLKAHLEAQFCDGMSWPVFHTGAIHIDHIRPLNTFDLDTPGAARAAWSLANLRPLWAADNLARPNDGSDVDWPCLADNDNGAEGAVAA